MLGLDPRMVKFGVVKLGSEKLESVAKYAEIGWKNANTG
jgi:hypothetical protein